jgi:glycosyltransferase involved in cell wall biosynthesis
VGLGIGRCGGAGRLKVLFIGYIWPEPRSSAAGLRSMSLIRAFREHGFEVIFASPAKDGPPSEALRSMGIQTHAIQPNDSSFDTWVAGLNPEFVVIERFMMEEQFGWRVAEHSPESVRVLDTVDLHFLRRARQAVLEQDPPERGSLAFADLVRVPQLASSEDALREVASIYRCDLTLLISRFEVALLTDARGPFRIPPALLSEFSFCYDPPAFPATGPGTDSRRDFVVIGNFRHEPNADGVRWLRKAVWPLIRKRLPQARVQVYGAYAPREMMALDDPGQGFLMRGSASDQYETLRRHLVNLAPLRFGAGLKGKIADGWWCGTPCVTTSIGAEGMDSPDTASLDGKARFGGLIADSPEQFAEAACLLYENREAHERARLAGDACLRECFSHDRNAKRLLQELLELRAKRREHRSANFTGRMLSHHHHRSTQYFSRWIELKNRKFVEPSPNPASSP